MNINIIKNIESPELKIYSGLSEPQLAHFYEPEPGLFIAESPMIIGRALAAGYVPESFLAEDRIADRLEIMIPEITTGEAEIPGVNKAAKTVGAPEYENVPVYSAPLNELVKITGYMFTRGVLCAMRRKAGPDINDILNNSKRVAVLENVMNPTNVGAIFRSAAALGMDAVILSEGCTDPLYRRAARVSMGTVFQIPWAYCRSENGTDRNCGHLISVLKDAGFTTAAMALNDDSVSLADFRPGPDEKTALVLGTEGEGLSAETVDACDITVRIPMAHGVDSLNVAAASAVAFWHINNCSLV